MPKKERVIKEIRSDGTVVLMNQRQERAWRRVIKTTIRNSATEAEPKRKLR